MKNGKYQNGGSKRVMVLALALVLLLGCGIGGTIAWLMDSTDAVVNTFTVGDVEITLKESPYNQTSNTYGELTDGQDNSYPIIPGTTYKKNPTVAVENGSEDCWLFVVVEKTNNPNTYLTYELELTGWTEVNSETNVYYREVKKTDTTRSWQLLKGNTTYTDGYITIKDTIVNDSSTDANAVKMPATGSEPKLSFTAYAVQTANRTVEQAWSLVDPTPATP